MGMRMIVFMVAVIMLMAVPVSVVICLVVSVFVVHVFTSLCDIRNPVATTKSSGCRILLFFFVFRGKHT